MKKLLILICLVYQIPASLQAFGPILTFFIRQFPEPVTIKNPDKLARSASKISLSRKIIRSICPKTNQGIIVTYAGFTAVSNFDGQITFPRMHQAPEFTLIITPEDKPIFMLGNTIHHWELIPGIAYSAYSIKRKQDPETGIYYWDVIQLDNLPNRQIPFKEAITLHAKPDTIIVPEGITITTKNPNLVLPQIYALKNRSGVQAALSFLKVRDFFSPIKRTHRKNNDTYFSSIIKGN
jgi:hypothetical protein